MALSAVYPSSFGLAYRRCLSPSPQLDYIHARYLPPPIFGRTTSARHHTFSPESLKISHLEYADLLTLEMPNNALHFNVYPGLDNNRVTDAREQNLFLNHSFFFVTHDRVGINLHIYSILRI